MIEKVVNVDLPSPQCRMRVYEFQNYNDFCETFNEIIANKEFCLDMKFEINSNSKWFGNNFEEIVDYMNGKKFENSVDKLIQTIKFTERAYQQGDFQRKKAQSAVAGSRPNISNYINGLPNAMYRYKKAPRQEKILNIFLDVSVHGYVEQKEKEEKFNEIFAYLLKLQLKGIKYRLNLIKIANFGYLHLPLVSFTIPLKREDEILNASRLAYPCISMSFFRGVILDGFYRVRHYSKNKGEYNEGVSKPFYCASSYIRASILQPLARDNDNVIYVSFKSDLERTFSELWLNYYFYI